MRNCFIKLTLLGLVSFFTACKEEGTIGLEQLESENIQLREEIALSEEYLENFSKEFDAITISLDSMSGIRDSLLIAAENTSSDRLVELEEMLIKKQEDIDKLRGELLNSEQSPMVIRTLKRQLDFAEKAIENLEKDNERLAQQKDSISMVLKNTQNTLLSSRNHAENIEFTLNQERNEFNRNNEIQNDILRSERAKNDELITESLNKISRSEQFFNDARIKLEIVDTFIEQKRNGQYIIRKKRDRDKAIELMRDVIDSLSKSKKLGFPKANQELDRIYASSKYESIRPIQ